MNKDMNAPPPGFVPPPPYQPGVPPPGPMQPNVVVIQSFGPDTQRMNCPHCGANVSTRVETEANTKTHLFALLLCLIGCWPCVPCPYCMDSCLVKKHFCPSCQSYLGQFENWSCLWYSNQESQRSSSLVYIYIFLLTYLLPFLQFSAFITDIYVIYF